MPSVWCLRHSSSGLFVVLNLLELQLASYQPLHIKMLLLYEEIQLIGIFCPARLFFSLLVCFVLHLVNTVYVYCENWVGNFLFFFLFFQKPKQKDWHPPGGFILGLWALIIMVFFKTYGIKHMKHIFWIWASKMIALAAPFGLIIWILWMGIMVVAKNSVEILVLKVLFKSFLLPLFLKRTQHG